MMIYFGLMLVGAFLLQGLFGLRQIKDFSTTFHRLRLQAPVAIGKNPKKVRSGTLMLLAVNAEGTILEAQMMKGVTVFAKFKEVKSLRKQNIAELAADHEFLGKFDKLTRVCFLDAYKAYINYRTKEMSQADFDDSIKIWSLPMVEKAKSVYYRFRTRKMKEGN